MKTPLKMSRATSAKELRAINPDLARKWAHFIDDNKTALVKQIAGKVRAS